MAIHSGVPLLAGWVAGLRCSSPLPCPSLSPMANVSGITRQQPLCMYGSAREAFVVEPPPTGTECFLGGTSFRVQL